MFCVPLWHRFLKIQILISWVTFEDKWLRIDIFGINTSERVFIWRWLSQVFWADKVCFTLTGSEPVARRLCSTANPLPLKFFFCFLPSLETIWKLYYFLLKYKARYNGHQLKILLIANCIQDCSLWHSSFINK